MVGTDGLPHDIKVIQARGWGLDEEAVNTVGTWRFDPALKDGNPVDFTVNIELDFACWK
jgi:periplasmic protein TonB